MVHRRVMLRWGECQTEHRHVQQINRDHCYDGHRYWQEFVPRRRPRSARRDRAAAEVVTRPDRSAAYQHAAVPDWHGSLRWRTSPEPQAASTRIDENLLRRTAGPYIGSSSAMKPH